jgi:RimJ/RimL family protein N-acetyltransferase
MGQAVIMPSLVAPVLPAGCLASRVQPVLELDGGLVLRPWRHSDAPAVIRAYADPAIRHWHLRSVDTDDEALAWIADWRQRWLAETDACWAVAEPGDQAVGRVVGRIALRDIDLAGAQGECTYWVLPDARGRGLAARAARALCRWAFRDVGFHRVTLAHSVANTASCRVAEKAGFAIEGTMRGYQRLADGWHDVHLHSRVCDDT